MEPLRTLSFAGSPMRPKSSPFLLWSGATLLLLTIVLSVTASLKMTPRITEEKFQVEQGPWQEWNGKLPSSEGMQSIALAFSLTLHPMHARVFQIIADDCVQSLTVNGQAVGQGLIPFCDLSRGRVLRLGSHLHAGTNRILMTIQNVGGPASYTWRIAWQDPLLLSLRILLLVGLLAGAILVAKGLALSRWQQTFFGIFCIGCALRLLYVFQTPYQMRAYDADGHLEYIQYVAQHLALPPIWNGWEFYQAPLYYVLTGLWVSIGSAYGRALPLLTRDIQWIAFFSSVLTLGTLGWIATLLFSRKEKKERLLFFALLSVLPSIVFLSPRINNDVLLLLWEVLCFGFLLLWWQRGQWRHWWIALLLLALSILTKTNGLLLVPVAFLLLACRRHLPLKRKALVGAMSLLLLTLLTGWIFTLREGISLSQPLVANTGNLSSALYVRNSVETFTEFNPLRMILTPYNNPWDDAAGRQYFWEYFFKSAFFGEFDLGSPLRPLASAVLFSALLSLLFAVYGAWMSIRKEGFSALPLSCTAIFLLLGHALHRSITPHSCAQDFRFSLLVSIPVLFFLVRGIKWIRSPWLRSTALLVILSTIVLQTALIVGVLTLP